MSPKILRRCMLCGKFHASYLVVDPAFCKGYLCYSCWKARQSAKTVPPIDQTTQASGGEPKNHALRMPGRMKRMKPEGAFFARSS